MQTTCLYHMHNDALVITLYVYNTIVKRVLIDPDSSVNFILLRVVKEIQVADRIIPKGSLFMWI